MIEKSMTRNFHGQRYIEINIMNIIENISRNTDKDQNKKKKLKSIIENIVLGRN